MLFFSGHFLFLQQYIDNLDAFFKFFILLVGIVLYTSHYYIAICKEILSSISLN